MKARQIIKEKQAYEKDYKNFLEIVHEIMENRQYDV